MSFCETCKGLGCPDCNMGEPVSRKEKNIIESTPGLGDPPLEAPPVFRGLQEPGYFMGLVSDGDGWKVVDQPEAEEIEPLTLKKGPDGSGVELDWFDMRPTKYKCPEHGVMDGCFQVADGAGNITQFCTTCLLRSLKANIHEVEEVK